MSGPAVSQLYGAAKAGITALTLSAAKALGRYGVRANAICPRARTAMTADVFGDAPIWPTVKSIPSRRNTSSLSFDSLRRPAAENVSGQVFVVYGPTVTLVAAPTAEHRFTPKASLERGGLEFNHAWLLRRP